MGNQVAILDPLPYGYKDLMPVMSEEILTLHYSKHHAGYVNKFNEALNAWEEAKKKGDWTQLVDLQSLLQFHGGGHLNHTFFWNSLAPTSKGGGGKPKGELKMAIEKDFGSFEKMMEYFHAMANGIQGSGWCWLVYNKNSHHLGVTVTQNHGTVTALGLTPLMVVDVWEHAYYLQYKNVRLDFVKAIDGILNWIQIEKRYEKSITY
jgi:superoxide dismutase, Fe-Mn family